MKKKIKLSRRQQGQAIVEMCASLIPILVILLGMIFVSGLCISNIRAFVAAKGNAEILSRTDGTVGGYGDNVYYWDYGDPDNNGDGYPFTADDQPVYFWQTGNESDIGVLAGMHLNESVGSEATENGDYVFVPVASLPYITDNNFAQTLPDDLLAAAELVGSQADSGFNSVFTIDSREFDADEINSLNAAFSYLVGGGIENINLRDMRANTVYYPVIPSTQ